MSVTAGIRKLLAKGFTVEQALDAADAFEGEMPKARTPGALRQERYRNRNKPSQGDACDDGDATLSPKKEIPPTPPKEKTTPIPHPSVVERASDFDAFWDLFPNKVGKRKAENEFDRALQRSSFDEIMAGLRRYVGKRDDRPWCNPSTFLHQNRWEDQPADVVPQRRSTAPPTHAQQVDDVLSKIINGNFDEHPGPTIDASYDRADSAGSASLVQFDAFATRRRT